MKKPVLLTVVALLVLAMSIVHAQDLSTKSDSLSPGPFALQFGIQNILHLTTFQGTSVSVRYQRSSQNAFRVGVAVGGETSDETNILSNTQIDTVFGQSSEVGSRNTQSITFNVQYLRFAGPAKIVRFYAGGGPLFQYNHSETKRNRTLLYQENPPTTQTVDSRVKKWGAGVSGLTGVEWSPSKWFSFHAEYSLSLRYLWQRNQMMTTNPTHYSQAISEESFTSKGWSLFDNGVNFGVSVFF
jgi:hypothetical protein